MQAIKKTLIFSFIAVICFITGIAVRGIYDDNFIGNDVFHVINLSDKNRNIYIKFPSGAEIQLNMKPNESTDLHVKETGEGGILVKSDGIEQTVGYVTTMNNTTVISIANNTVSFSQIFRKSAQPVNAP
jgi:hypothetical protein